MSKVMLVTGASAGIGREVAILLAGEGHTVYAGARRLDRMQDLTEHGITPVGMDVTKEDDNERVVSRIIESEGRIDVLINNAGFGLYGPVEDIPLDDARYQFEVNLFGLAHLTQLVLPHMRAQRSGRIINVSSMLGKVFVPMGAWYHATKHALEGWSDCLRLETAPFNIQVVIIEPGAIRTEFAEAMMARIRQYSDDTAYKPQVDRFLKRLDGPRPRGARHRRPGHRQGVPRGRDHRQTPPEICEGSDGAARDVPQEVVRGRDLRIRPAAGVPMNPFGLDGPCATARSVRLWRRRRCRAHGSPYDSPRARTTASGSRSMTVKSKVMQNYP
ncbi:oxidoreductase [Candidatus Palauibacter sp.]|uniref:oxidoreductase n=1 Tax=Candidatus Palauibacter sp. TaxID=3101350 RepID=UPI003B015A2B